MLQGGESLFTCKTDESFNKTELQKMKTLLKHLTPAVMLFAFCGACIAGPTVVVHPKGAGVTIRDPKFEVVHELKDPKQIKVIQDAFLRAKGVGDTTTKLKGGTHKIDFSDRWLVDLESGEIGVLTMAVTEVYQLDPTDLVTLRDLLKPTAEQASAGQPATHTELKSEGGDKPQPESQGRSR